VRGALRSFRYVKAFSSSLRYLCARAAGHAVPIYAKRDPKMQTVTSEYAAEHLEVLIEQVRGGADIVIARDGIPVARLVPIHGGDDEAHAPDEEVDAAFHGD
jgi:acetylornithine deacetylase/succinyl-diaminopimelate desuccinylase-like protein